MSAAIPLQFSRCHGEQYITTIAATVAAELSAQLSWPVAAIIHQDLYPFSCTSYTHHKCSVRNDAIACHTIAVKCSHLNCLPLSYCESWPMILLVIRGMHSSTAIACILLLLVFDQSFERTIVIDWPISPS